MDEKENPEWRERVDSVILYDRIEELRVKIRDLEHLVTKGKDNLRSEYRRHDELLTRIYAILWQDAAGQKGLLHDVDILMGRRSAKDEVKGFRWQFWGVVVAAGLGLAGVIFSHLPQIKKSLNKPDPFEQMIEHAKHPKSRHRHVVIRETEEEPPDTEP